MFSARTRTKMKTSLYRFSGFGNLTPSASCTFRAFITVKRSFASSTNQLSIEMGLWRRAPLEFITSRHGRQSQVCPSEITWISSTSLFKRKRDEGLRRSYHAISEGCPRQKGCERSAFSTHVYYMPHGEVVREASRTTRLRVIFDTSSHASRVSSLNSHLKKAPNLGAGLLRMLINF